MTIWGIRVLVIRGASYSRGDGRDRNRRGKLKALDAARACVRRACVRARGWVFVYVCVCALACVCVCVFMCVYTLACVRGCVRGCVCG